jgi:hypothetical protein
VWAGWNIGTETVGSEGTLLGPEETPVGVFSGGRPWWLSSNASVVGVVAAGVAGVWLCVECCIVDASILL